MLPGYEFSSANMKEKPTTGSLSRKGRDECGAWSHNTDHELLSCSHIAMAGLHDPAAAEEHRRSLKPSLKAKGITLYRSNSEDAVVK